MLASFAVALVLAAPVPEALPTSIAYAGPEVPSSTSELADRWLARNLPVRADTTWRVARRPLVHGGEVIIAEELWRGLRIAGARVALRVGPGGRLRQTVGRVLPRDAELGSVAPVFGPRHLWWPTANGLRLARLEDGPVTFAAGSPHQVRRAIDLETGATLAEESIVVELGTEVTGWSENPITTPDPIVVPVDLLGDPPLALDTEDLQVLHCEFDPIDACINVSFPLSDDQGAFPSVLPAWDDEAAQADPDDPFAPLQSLQGAVRFQEALVRWGWSPAVWDTVNCEWQEVPSEQCRLVFLTNVRGADEAGEPVSFNGAVYHGNGFIRMGQGANADASYDIEVVVHEFGHHVSQGMASGEPIDWEDDGQRWRHDRTSINEGSSDFYGSLIGTTPELYDYFRNLGGVYLGARKRDVSIPFRCPENVAGEVHMAGRIWASAMHTLHETVQDSGWGDADTFPSIFLGAMVTIRSLPRDVRDQFADASAILADEVELTLGAEAGDVARSILAERGLLACNHLIDLAFEPTVTGTLDETDPLDARFMVLPGYKADGDPEIISDHPRAPAVQHQVTLRPGEDRITLEFVPDRWRTTQIPSEPLDQEGLVAAALVKSGGDIVRFWIDEESERVVNDAERWDRSEPMIDDPARHVIEIAGLVPGQTYAIALVSLTGVSDNSFLIDDMRWTIDSGPSGTTSGGTDSDSNGVTTQMSLSSNCACRAQGSEPRSWLLWVVLISLVSARRSTATVRALRTTR